MLTDPECYSAEKRRKSSKKTTSMSLGESAKYLASSKYIRDLATLVIAYGTPFHPTLVKQSRGLLLAARKFEAPRKGEGV